MTWPKRKKAWDQRRKRRQKHERAFLFTAEGHLLGEVERVQWEVALADCGGDVADAATACGLTDIPKGAKALWGRSAEAAWSTTATGRSSARAPEEHQRPASPRARSAQRGRVQRTQGYRVRLYV
jgi:hypothetical protein